MSATDQTRMTDEQIKEKYRELTHITFNEGKLGAELDDYITDDYIEHVTGPQHGTTDRAGYVALIEELRRGFPDIDFRIEDCVLEGDTIAVRNVWTGTNTGPFMGNPPTGKAVTVEAMGFARLVEGGSKVAEHWGVVDMLGLRAQIGAMGGPPGGGPPGAGGPPGGGGPPSGGGPPTGGAPGGGPPFAPTGGA